MKKNVAVVGYGGQGGWHANQILASDVVALAGVYDIDPAKLELAKSRGIRAYESLDEILQDENVEIVVVATPNDSHKSISISSMEAGKHVICEKPLTGYFGMEGDVSPIGKNVPKRKMYEELLVSMERIREAVDRSGKKFMYAENFIYAPAVQKIAEVIAKKKSRILCLKGEESLKG